MGYKEGYKVVQEVRGGFISTISTYGKVIYKVGEPVYPKSDCGPLCVFSDIEEATIFLKFLSRRMERLSLFKVMYLPSDNDRVWEKTPSNFVYLRGLISFFGYTSTKLASEVILKERIEVWNQKKGIK